MTIGKTIDKTIIAREETLFELLSKNWKIKEEFGRITCIEDVCANGNYWWQFFIDNKLLPASPTNYYPKDGDKITIIYGDER